MSHTDYFIVTLSNLTAQEAEIASAMAFEAGAAGTEEALAFQQLNREYEPVTIETERTQIKIYFQSQPPETLLADLRSRFEDAHLFVHGESDRDWLAEWKRGFKPFCLAGKIWIVPSWCEPPAQAEEFLRLDPGMAFGTGTHETTRLAASFLNEYSLQQPMASSTRGSLLDVGTGTGILAMQAERLGWSSILANDVDPEARRVARENLELNRSRVVQVVDDDLSTIPGQFHWVVANIIDGVLVKLQKELREHVAANGYLLLTGILAERDELFRSEFSFLGFEIVERRTLGEWVGYLLHKI